MRELDEEPLLERVRQEGGGRKKAEDRQPHLLEALDLEANPKTEKRTIVKWTSHSLAHITQAVRQRGFQITQTAVRRILKDKGYALKAKKKEVEAGRSHPDRDRQFQQINTMGLKMHLLGFPLLSIDCKKTEKIGHLKNNGREWMPQGEETHVTVYDFGQKDESPKKIQKAMASGIYDLLKKEGFVNVGIDANTAEFACASARAVVFHHRETRVSTGLRTPAGC